MVLWCMQLQCHYESLLHDKQEKYDATVKGVIRCETLRSQLEEAIHELEKILPPLRTMVHDCEPYRRRKAEVKKIRTRIMKALSVLLEQKTA